MNRLQVRSKIWLEIGGAPFFGAGREELLRLIDERGSINAAAQEMGISYRKAWSQLRAMEEMFGAPIVCRSKGGAGGGESTLTPAALELLERYARLHRGINRFVDDRFAEVFIAAEACSDGNGLMTVR